MTTHSSNHSSNIATALWMGADRAPGATALDDLSSGQRRTYDELRTRAAGVGAGLLAQGLQPGDRVALLLQNSCDYVEAFLGSLAAGLVVVPLNTRLTVHDFSHMLGDAGVAALVTEPPFVELLAAEPSIAVPFVIDVTGTTSSLKTLDDVMVDPAGFEVSHQDPGDLATLMYTSGTTGAPKAVMLSHGAWSSVSDTCVDLLGFEDGIRTMHPAPLTHGAGFLLLPTLRSLGTNLLVRSYDADDVARRIGTGEAQGMFLVPSMIRMLLDVLPEDWVPSPDFRWIYYAGSPIDVPTFHEATQRFGGRLVQSFAQMESPMFLTSLSDDEHRAAASDPDSTLPRSAGRVIEGRTLLIADEGAQEVAPGVVGEVWAKAPQMMSGYWRRPEETEKTLKDGWLHTGDMGYVDDDGYLFLVDRVKDMIVTGGSNVYAREVEEVLIDIPGVERAAVIGLPHRVWGEEVTAVLVASPGSAKDAAAVQAQCRAALAGYKVPKRVIWLDELPTNAYGKVLKRELRKSLHDRLAST
jgi:acyl-CoA synthetase (AMP-forming)/AMP-acid ligase II